MLCRAGACDSMHRRGRQYAWEEGEAVATHRADAVSVEKSRRSGGATTFDRIWQK